MRLEGRGLGRRWKGLAGIASKGTDAGQGSPRKKKRAAKKKTAAKPAKDGGERRAGGGASGSKSGKAPRARAPKRSKDPPAAEPISTGKLVDPECVPKGTWHAWSGRQPKVLNEQADRYGIPIGGPTIRLRDVARWIHNTLADHGAALQRSMRDEHRGGGQLEAGGRSRFADAGSESAGSDPSGEGSLFRKDQVQIRAAEVSATLKELELAEKLRQVVHVAHYQAALSALITQLRVAGEQLGREHGPAAAEVLQRALDRGELAALNALQLMPERADAGEQGSLDDD